MLIKSKKKNLRKREEKNEEIPHFNLISADKIIILFYAYLFIFLVQEEEKIISILNYLFEWGLIFLLTLFKIKLLILGF